jgi:deazaflavin-dependent oxidoreductase (nitroreductase family)
VYNLRARPQVKIEVRNQTLDVTARELEGDERDRVWTRLVETAPNFAEYQKKTDRVIALFELVR